MYPDNIQFHRQLSKPSRSFFLFGPRATGKSTWLKANFPNHWYVDLLRNDVYFTLTSAPRAFRERVLAYDPKKTWIIIDEVQRVPEILNGSLVDSSLLLSYTLYTKYMRGVKNMARSQSAVTLSVRISPKSRHLLEQLSEATGRTRSFLAAEAIENYLVIQAWQVNSIQKAVEKANSKKSKLIDHHKVTDWLNSWGSQDEKESPE